MKKLFLLMLLLPLVLINIGINSTNAHSSSTDSETVSQEGNKEDKYKLQVLKSDEIGKYLADASGMTLYYFLKDEPGVSNCTDECSEIWPPFFAENIKTSKGFKESDFGMITREDGQKQTTYKGHPLYYFAKDQEAGDTNGQGVKNVWFVLNKKSFEDN
jgi:predicted lipoprotein with Yx(FWY)xxD motif